MTDQSARPDKTTITVSPETKTQIRRSAAEAIASALAWISSSATHTYWTDFTMLDRACDVWVTAHTLARLGELPLDHIPPFLQQQIEASLNWLEKERITGTGWSSSGSREPDAFTTAWVILALRAHGRAVPRSAIDFLLGCRQANGGFSLYPHRTNVSGVQALATVETTVSAVRSLSMCDSAVEEFLTSRLRPEMPTTATGRVARFFACSEILDWESGLAPWSLLNRTGQCAAQLDLENPYEQAMLLRSLLRLRNQRAWPASAALRAMQLPDGSWPACPAVAPVTLASSPVSFADTRVVTTVNALAALVMSESQPGLYFGSDLPQARRYQES